MRTAIILISGLAMSGLVTATARGDFVGLAVVLEFANQPTIVGPRAIYRVYAEFTDPADRVESWFGNNANPFVIQNVLADGSTLGSGFLNLGGGDLAPRSGGTGREWDTFATIGVRYGEDAFPDEDQTSLTPGFPVFISGNNVSSSDGAVFVPTTAPQGRADFRVNGNDTNLRVLLMQLTVQVGQHVRGTLNVSGQFDTPSGPQSFTALGQTFNSVPAPGALTFLLITLAQFRGGRRRKM